MSRPIKFRAWGGGDMVGGIPVTATKRWADQSSPRDYITVGEAEQDYDDGSRWVLMQYTGLKDRHGVEIYEGDLLTNGWLFLGEVLFEDGTFICEDRLGTYIDRKRNGRRSELFKLEVVGNIHENPELLESTQ